MLLDFVSSFLFLWRCARYFQVFRYKCVLEFVNLLSICYYFSFNFRDQVFNVRSDILLLGHRVLESFSTFTVCWSTKNSRSTL